MAQLKDSLITGDLRVTGTIYGKATNAVLADEATAIKDKSNGTLTYLNYGATGMSTTSWIGSWDGYTLKAISPANLKTTMALNNVENTKLSTWAGSGNITTIGTLTSGTVPWARLSGVPSSFTPAAHNHDSSYVNITGDTMTGALTLSGDPTSAKHAATKQYVDQSFAANDAMVFKGTIAGGSSSPGSYTAAAERGHTYKVSTAGYVNGNYLEAGDMLICTTDSTAAATSSNYSTIKANWTIVQTNLDGAVIGPTSATDKQIAIFNGTSGKVIKGGTIGSHSYTPAGTITLTNGNTTTTVSAASSGTTTYTPGGTVSQPTFTGSNLTSTGNFTPAGSVSVSTNATTNKTATVSAASSGTTTYTPGGTNSVPAFTGTAATIVVSGGTGTATYTPAGTIAVNAAGSTVAADDITAWTTNTPTSVTKKTVVVSATVSNEILTISTGDSVDVTAGTAASLSYTARTVKSGDASYSFTGTGTRLTASYTPAGSVAAPTFTGTAVRLVTGKIAVPNTYTATFTGTQGTVSVSGTPTGTVSQPTFSGTAVRLVTGNISRPTSATFTGTAATLSHSIS